MSCYSKPISKNSYSPTIKHNNQREIMKSTNLSKPKDPPRVLLGSDWTWVLLKLLSSDLSFAGVTQIGSNLFRFCWSCVLLEFVEGKNWSWILKFKQNWVLIFIRHNSSPIGSSSKTVQVSLDYNFVPLKKKKKDYNFVIFLY